MAVINAKQVLSDLYGLMMEINLHRSDEDVLADLEASPDPQIEIHLQRIRQITAKLKAASTRSRFEKALEQIALLKAKGIEELKKFLQPAEQAQLIPLFRKFEELTPEDEASILEDQELLQLLKILKDRLDENPEL